MSRSRVEIELSRILCILAFKSHFTISRTQVKSFLKIELESGIAGFYNTGTTHVENTHFTACQEIRSFQRINRFQLQHFAGRHGAANNHTVVHGINHVHFIRRENSFDQEIPTNTFRIILPGIFRMRSITQFIICFHILICI